jgi:hypothetical protein
MANGYNPRQFMTSLSNIAQQSGAQGLRWMGQQKGLGRQSIRNYLNMMANAASTASSQLGIGNLLAKGAGLVATAAGGPIFGGLVTGGISKFTGDRAVSGLAQDAAGFDMDSILYGRDKAEEAMSTATGAIDKLIGSVDAQAMSSAITTPLLYMTLQNTFSSLPEAGTAFRSGSAGTLPSGVQSPIETFKGKTGTLPNLNPEFASLMKDQGLNYAQALQAAKTGQMATAANVTGGASNPFKSLMSLLGSKNQFINNFPIDSLEEELKFNPYGGNYNNPGGIY